MPHDTWNIQFELWKFKMLLKKKGCFPAGPVNNLSTTTNHVITGILQFLNNDWDKILKEESERKKPSPASIKLADPYSIIRRL